MIPALAATLAQSATDGFDPNDVSPGVLGFLVIFVAAVACIPLFWSMTAKLRKIDRRARLEDEAAQADEQAAAATPAEPGPAPDGTDRGPSGPDQAAGS